MLSNNVKQIDFSTLEKVITTNDLSGLNSKEKVDYMVSVCNSLGLNPMTRPFQLLKFQGKETLYAAKDCTEQLRKKHNVSIMTLESNILEGGVYIVKAVAKLPCGRMDSSTGVLSIKGLSGDALANAMMKTETKAKRRVTLSICGLGMLDESELDTMSGAQRIDIDVIEHKRYDDKTKDLDLMKVKILFNGSSDMKALEENFKIMIKAYPQLKEEIIVLKDLKKEMIIDRDMASLIDEKEVSNESI